MSVMKKGLTLNQVEQARLAMLNRVLEKQVTVKEAGRLLGLSERHTWRMVAAYRKNGASAIAHGNRGRAPANGTPKNTSERVVFLANTSYAGFNHTHLTEMLTEKEGITLSRSAVRSILLKNGLKSNRHRRPPVYRCRRPRMSHEGMLIQMDGSYHDWLEGRGPWLTLLLAVDDATGTVPYALFREQEDTNGYFMLIEGIIRRFGIPMAAYTDRHSVFKSTWEPPGNNRLTQFTRAMKELGVTMIVARSPQAKGRIERMAGTFQDRLASELRMAGASDIEAANRILADFIPRFNVRFGVAPAKTQVVYRQLDPALDLSAILCCRFSHMVARDNTIKHRGRALQLLGDLCQRSYAGFRVELRQYPDGRLAVFCGGRQLNSLELPQKIGYFYGKRSPSQSRPIPEWLKEALDRAGTKRRPSSPRTPTPRQQALWEAVQGARNQGLSKRAIAKTLGISRNTVRKYFSAISPPITRLGRLAQVSGTVIST